MPRDAVVRPKLLNDKFKLGFPDNLVIAGFKVVELLLSLLWQTPFHLHDLVLLLKQPLLFL